MSQNHSSARRKTLPRPLNNKNLHDLALFYVARYATSQKKVSDYLKRKIRERGWDDDTPPHLDEIVARLTILGYINDLNFAAHKSESLMRRGYGMRRIQAALRVAGISDADKQAALSIDESTALQVAMIYARKKKLGPFSAGEQDHASRKKHFATMCRAGHDFSIVQQILDLNVDFFQD